MKWFLDASSRNHLISGSPGPHSLGKQGFFTSSWTLAVPSIPLTPYYNCNFPNDIDRALSIQLGTGLFNNPATVFPQKKYTASHLPPSSFTPIPKGMRPEHPNGVE